MAEGAKHNQQPKANKLKHHAGTEKVVSVVTEQETNHVCWKKCLRSSP